MTKTTENASAEDLDDAEDPSSVVSPSKPRLLKILGPGLITGASDDDPSGIATYSQAGAQFGYGLTWTLFYTFPLMVAVQMISARIGRTTGHGIAGNLRMHYPNWLLQITILPLLVANTINLGADLGAMADAANLLLPAPRWIYVVLFAGICVYMQMFLQYTRYVSILKWLTIALFAYFGTLLAIKIDWAALGSSFVFPRIEGKDALTTVVALFGTTISPYLFFWQSAEEVENIHVYPHRQDLFDAPEQGPAALHRMHRTPRGSGSCRLLGLCNRRGPPLASRFRASGARGQDLLRNGRARDSRRHDHQFLGYRPCPRALLERRHQWHHRRPDHGCDDADGPSQRHHGRFHHRRPTQMAGLGCNRGHGARGYRHGHCVFLEHRTQK
jgi:hypothetical protein